MYCSPCQCQCLFISLFKIHTYICTFVSGEIVSLNNTLQVIAKWCQNNQIDMVVVGPEDPLANGLGDELLKAGIRCFGPGKQGARIEADKKWAKDFMLRHNIPTARYQTFTDCTKAKEFILKYVPKSIHCIGRINCNAFFFIKFPVRPTRH